MTAWVNVVHASLLAAGLTLGAVASAADPSVSVPSTPDADGKVLIRGTDLAAYSNVTVRFIHGQMAPIDMVTMVGANGAFAVKFEPPVVGGYSVVVYDGGGRQVGKGSFGHFR